MTPSAFSSLKRPDFLRWYLGQAVSLLGTWMRGPALGWLAFQWTGSELKLGLAFMSNTLPLLLFSPLAGSLADRLPKRGIVLATSWLSLAASAGMAVLLFADRAGMPAVYAAGAVWGLAQAFEMPARQSMVVELAGKAQLGNAIALNSMAFNLARVLGPALGGLVLGRWGAGVCFAADALSFGAVLYSLYSLPSTAAPRRRQGDHGGMSLALGHLWADPFLKRTLLWLMAASLFGWSAQSQMAAFAKRHLGLGAMGYGSLVALNGLGAATAAFWIAARHGGRRPGRQMAAGLALLCASMLLLGMAGTWAWAAPLLLLNGAGMILFFSSGNTSLQARVPHHLRGRAMGVWAFIFGGAMPIGALLLGLFAERWGSARAIQASGAACALMTAAVWLGVPVKEQG